MKIKYNRSIKGSSGYPVKEILWVLDGDDNTWKTWGSAGPKLKAMSNDEIIDELNAQGNNYIDVLITKNGENPDEYGYTENIKDPFIKSACNGKKSVKAASITAAADMSGMKIVVNHRAMVDITPDDYENGADSRIVNTWDFEVRGEYDTIQELVDRIASVSYVFSDNVSDYYYMDGMIHTSATVNNENEIPSEDEIEAWKQGMEDLYIADMYLSLDVSSGSHEMSEEEAKAFGINIY